MSYFRKTPILATLCMFALAFWTTTASGLAQDNVVRAGQIEASGPSFLHTPTLSVTPHDHMHGADDPYCGTDLYSPEARAVMAQIMDERKAGLRLPLRKGGNPPDIGDQQTFNVSETDSNGDPAWIPLEFELVDTTGLYHLWVEVAELDNGRIDNSHRDALRQAVVTSTPSRSINPRQGIFANNNDIFGMPPDIDGDGIVDILIYDIGRAFTGTVGYVSGTDQLISPPEGTGNQRDILYLDSRWAANDLQALANVAAHEYAHLINFSYEYYNTFISEGLAEFASVMNGYYWRTINYVSNVAEVSLPLFNWEPAPSPPDPTDYQRGNLFMSYIGEQYGPEVVGEIMWDPGPKSVLGFDAVMANHGSSLSDVILDFHTANYLNDRTDDVRFGYEAPEYARLNAFLTSPPVNGEIPSTEGEGGFSLDFEASINAGSVHYMRLSDAADLTLVYDTPDPTGIFYSQKQARNRARLLLDHADGSFSIQDIFPGTDEIQVDGSFEAVTFVMIHGNPDIAIGDVNALEAFWTPLSMATEIALEPLLPESPQIESVYPNPFSGFATTRLKVPEHSVVTVELFDLLGRSRQVISDGMLPAGTHDLRIEGHDLESGTYLLRISQDGTNESRLITVVR